MKYIGLLKWFDNDKGFGKIGTPDDGDIFIHLSKFLERPEELLISTPLIFEIKNDNRGLSAFNAYPPSSYEDFELILANLKRNSSLTTEVSVTSISRWGKKYIRKESESFSLIGCSLHQLLQNMHATIIYNFFKNYFDEHYLKEDYVFIVNYLEVTKKSIQGINIELNGYLLEGFKERKLKLRDDVLSRNSFLNSISPKNYLVQCLFKYFLDKLDKEFLYDIWKNKLYIIESNFGGSVDDSLICNNYFEFPSEIFLSNISEISCNDLRRILYNKNGIEIVMKLVEHKIANLESIFSDSVRYILESFQVLSTESIVVQLKELFTDKILLLLSKYDFSEIDNERINIFKRFVYIFKNEANDLNYEYAIQKFNINISDEVKFKLWQMTKYYIPDKELVETNLTDLSLTDFLDAPNELHIDYFSNNFNKIEELESIENFGLLTFLIIESPHNAIIDIFTNLIFKYKAAYWLSFPKVNGYWEKYYQADYEINDIPFNTANFINYLDGVSNLNDLFIAYELVNKIQIKYKDSVGSQSKNVGFLKLSEQDRKDLIQEILLESGECSKANVVELFKIALNKSPNEDSVSLCKYFIPKFINEDFIGLCKLISSICTPDVDICYRQEIFSHISEQSSKFEKVYLWLNDYTTKVDFNIIIEEFDKFPHNQQPYLLRKLFSLIHRNRVVANKNVLAQLFNLSTSQKLNLDVRICLAVINSLSNKHIFIGENVLSDIVCQFVNENVNDIIQIYDLFQVCKGRTRIKYSDDVRSNWFLNIEGQEFIVNGDSVRVNERHYTFNKESKTVEIEGETYSFKWVKRENNFIIKLYDKPMGITFCDAVKSEIDEFLGKRFYWCCNSKCFSPCQGDHIHLEWSKYSLRDFIKILKLPFAEDEYYRFVSMINRSNRLLKKLKCNECNQLLRDTKTSQFSFYRVTTFHCTNSECSKHHEVVYLNHCLNWKCLNVVDSRISHTCSNGWYLCDSCGNCCSQKILENRLANLLTNKAFNPNNPRHHRLKYQVDNKLGHEVT